MKYARCKRQHSGRSGILYRPELVGLSAVARRRLHLPTGAPPEATPNRERVVAAVRSTSSVPTMLTTLRSVPAALASISARSLRRMPVRRRLPRSRSFRVHHLRGLDSLREKANPPVDLAQPPLPVLIVGVFTAIAVAGGPRHHLRHGRAFSGEQKPVLLFETLKAAWCYVVLDWCRGLVWLRLSRKPFSHSVVLQARIQWALPGAQKMIVTCLFIHCRLDSALQLAQRPKKAAGHAQILSG